MASYQTETSRLVLSARRSVTPHKCLPFNVPLAGWGWTATDSAKGSGGGGAGVTSTPFNVSSYMASGSLIVLEFPLPDGAGNRRPIWQC